MSSAVQTLKRAIDEMAKPLGLNVSGDGILTVANRDAWRVRLWSRMFVAFEIDAADIESGDDNAIKIVSKKIDDAAIMYAAGILRGLPPELRAKAVYAAENEP